MIARLRPGVSPNRANERATAAYRATHTQEWEKANRTGTGRSAAGAGARNFPRDARGSARRGGRRSSCCSSLVATSRTCCSSAGCGATANSSSRRRWARAVVGSCARCCSRPRGSPSARASSALLVVTTGGTLLRRVFLSPIAALASPLDGRLVLVTVAFCVASAFLLGLAPAIRLSTRRALSPGHAAVVRASRVLDVFSGLQVALSLPMVIAAALFVVSLWNARHQDLGMETGRVAVVTTNLFEVGRPWENHATHRQMQARVARLPQVESTAVIAEPANADKRVMFGDRSPWQREPVEGNVLERQPADVQCRWIRRTSPLMRHAPAPGPLFTEDENRPGARSVAVITESMARYIWPSEPAIGKCFYLGGKGNDNGLHGSGRRRG